ncbi:MAG: NADPH-dependent 7-cyano-7-deazaguanine reductase QueF [Elusimicrobia bacterium CG_4_10_14_3_um_filter_49_12_50_7]|nr:MAG: NADPH-dependent 7-cyano-7-deazaguanine reductase QueF [Elusimicrobia bacterium CG03_land_8_20_14_0_80_50_18]PIX16555.1 MAG: NADPH-dependent 7-cyano-7-deazaguanine reductase QueF [Elusimicrobia bacterium CG_4_8_14_3_um_filter_50_9]PIY17689.1 MAG: NADPH-dependent 7-cyano-7-deazaguanine reductase QueF [Elusimicrobia bacterium CG_4_10_14_3_um_filter_49_12_50_7]
MKSHKNKTYGDCATSGIKAKLPAIDVWRNTYKKYEIVIEYPEFNTICPLAGLPDIGTLVIRYVPDKYCVEMKSLKLYLVSYRNLGIFQENAVNKVLEDIVKYVKPKSATVECLFNARGGMSSKITAKYKRGRSLTY